jgi:hypothetical protein
VEYNKSLNLPLNLHSLEIRDNFDIFTKLNLKLPDSLYILDVDISRTKLPPILPSNLKLRGPNLYIGSFEQMQILKSNIAIIIKNYGVINVWYDWRYKIKDIKEHCEMNKYNIELKEMELLDFI